MIVQLRNPSLIVIGDRDTLHKSQKYWTLHDVLSFGCNTVRGDFVDDGVENDTLLRFVFSTFLQVPKMNNQTVADVPRFVSFPSLRKLDDETQVDLSMTRYQVGYMLLLLMDHANYRANTDAAPKDNVDHPPIVQKASFEKLLKEQRLENVKVDTLVAVKFFGTLPLPSKSTYIDDSSQVPLSSLVDAVFEYGAGNNVKDTSKENLYFQGFVKWYNNASAVKDKSHESKFSRIGALLLDLRLVASTLFGIKPSSPLLERTLIDEIFLRYNKRFPSSGMAKRGPSETVWYVIPSSWWRKWGKYVDDCLDTHSRSVLSPTENDKLLCNNGSLALRANLRNKQDFEVRNSYQAFKICLIDAKLMKYFFVLNSCYPRWDGVLSKLGMMENHTFLEPLFQLLVKCLQDHHIESIERIKVIMKLIYILYL